jgi:hypothetical protein
MMIIPLHSNFSILTKYHNGKLKALQKHYQDILESAAWSAVVPVPLVAHLAGCRPQRTRLGERKSTAAKAKVGTKK